MPNRIAKVLCLRIMVLSILIACFAACGPGAERPPRDATRAENGTSQPMMDETATEVPEREGRQEGDSSAPPVEVETSVIATYLEVPWGIAFLPDGDALFTERDPGRLLRMDASGNIEEVQTLPTRGFGEGGSLGLAVSPDYEEDGHVYAYYTTEVDNRVVRFRLGEEPEPILTGIPFNSYHDGGRIAFGPDGMLYIATGDAGDPSNAQNLSSLGGKILRLTPGGDIPEDNPFPNSPVYSYGHRNVEGLAWDEEGQLFASEFGQDAFDEVNRIESGENYGWPEVEGDGGEEATAAGYVNPITTWSTDEASPSGAEILVNGAIPQWEGDLFVAALRGERLWRLELDEEGNVVGRQELLRGAVGRIRNVVQAPDGSLWVTTSNLDGGSSPAPQDDRILRLAPAEG